MLSIKLCCEHLVSALVRHDLQVGSKNAAFFMGKCIKIATRSTNSSFVHELGIAAADLEERYKAHEAHLLASHLPCPLIARDHIEVQAQAQLGTRP